MGDSSGHHSFSATNKLKMSGYTCFPFSNGLLILQVEISGGRGKPSVLIDKDEGLEKVKTTHI